jgi:hypothetical protein
MEEVQPANPEAEGAQGEPEPTPVDDDQVAFLQTEKALQEALQEQKILREKLTTLETRNRPPKWGRPITVQNLDATRGKSDRDGEIAPEQLLAELKTAQHMLESAKRASEAARAEKKHVEHDIRDFRVSSQEEGDELLRANAIHHKQAIQAEQNQLRIRVNIWGGERLDLQSSAEELSMLTHGALHNSSEARTAIDTQRRRIRELANDLRRDLIRTKELHDTLEEAKARLTMVDNLIAETDANRRQAEHLEQTISEQKQILRAVRVSKQAQTLMDDLAAQIAELHKAKESAELQAETAENDVRESILNEERLAVELEVEQTRFTLAQMEVSALDAEMKELRAEFQREKNLTVLAGRKNVDLHTWIREERVDATARFLLENSHKIHRMDRVQTTLMNVREHLITRERALPPLTADPSLGPRRTLSTLD